MLLYKNKHIIRAATEVVSSALKINVEQCCVLLLDGSSGRLCVYMCTY